MGARVNLVIPCMTCIQCTPPLPTVRTKRLNTFCVPPQEKNGEQDALHAHLWPLCSTSALIWANDAVGHGAPCAYTLLIREGYSSDGYAYKRSRIYFFVLAHCVHGPDTKWDQMEQRCSDESETTATFAVDVRMDALHYGARRNPCRPCPRQVRDSLVTAPVPCPRPLIAVVWDY